MAGFDILNLIGEPWNEAESLFGGIKLNVTDTASRGDSRFLEMILNGTPRYTVWKTGETFISNAAGTSHGGFGMRGNAGEMALTSQIDANSGRPADVIRYYWDNSNVGSHPNSVAVIRGMGNNRLSIESSNTMVHVAQNGRYEFEGFGAPYIQFIGYEAASANGKPFLFHNYNQTSYANSVVQMGVQIANQDAAQFGTWDGTTFTAAARVDGTGVFYGRGAIASNAPGTPHGFAAQSLGNIVPKLFMGIDASENPFFGMGPGNAGFDTLLMRAGPNLLGVGGITSAHPAIKRAGTRIQARIADDSAFAPVQGKLTTDQTAAPGTITPTATLTLYDASGTAYKVPCAAA
jgi:hypothetical protein